MSGPQATSYWPSLILQIRTSLSLSQEEFAEIVDSNQATISRWEKGIIAPSYEKQKILESIASKENISSLGGMLELVRNSPSRMFLIDQNYFVIAASASCEWNENTTVEDQISADASSHFTIVSAALDNSGFWRGIGGLLLKYDYNHSGRIWHSVITSVVIRGRVYAVVQQLVHEQSGIIEN